MDFSDSQILKILIESQYLSESQHRDITKKANEIRRNLRQIHNVTIGGVTKE
jgi:hypothetical protein